MPCFSLTFGDASGPPVAAVIIEAPSMFQAHMNAVVRRLAPGVPFGESLKLTAKMMAAIATRQARSARWGEIPGDSLFTSRRDQIVLLTTRHAIPTIFPWREYVTGGGLLSYGTSLQHSYQEMAGYVALILKGAKTTDLPVRQPSTFEIVVNLKAARVLGLTIPDSILVRADEVIE